jgi:hypothetical protein
MCSVPPLSFLRLPQIFWLKEAPGHPFFLYFLSTCLLQTCLFFCMLCFSKPWYLSNGGYFPKPWYLSNL